MKINGLKLKSINSIVLLNIIGTMLYQGINFLLTPILTRALGTYDFGLVTLYTTWVNFIFPVIGLSTTVVIPYIKIKIEEKEQNKYISALAGLSATSFIVFSSFAILFLNPISKAMHFEPIVVVMMFVQAFGMIFVNFMVSYCIQYKKTIQQFSFTITVSVLSFATTILLLKYITKPELKYLCRVIGFAIPYFLLGVIAFGIIVLKGKKVFSISIWKVVLPICLPIIFHSISHIVLSQSDKIMIQNLMPNGVSKAGLFGFAHTVASIGTVMWTALNNAWTPFYYDMLKEEDFEKIDKKSNNYLYLYTSLYCMFYLIIPEFSKIMGGTEFLASLNVVPIIYLGVYFIFLYSFPVNFKTVNNQTISIAIGTISAAVCNIVLNLLLIPKLGILGAAMTSLFSYILLFLFHHFTVGKKQNGYKYKITFFTKGVLAVALCTLIYYTMLPYVIIRFLIVLIIGILLVFKTIKQRSIF